MKRKTEVVLIGAIFLILILMFYFYIFNSMDNQINLTKILSQEDIPPEMIILGNSLGNLSNNSEIVKSAFNIVDEKYTSERFYYLREPVSTIFINNISEMWRGISDRPCNIQSLMLKILLLESRRFSEEDIIPHYSLSGLTPHQILRIRVDERWISADVFYSKLSV